MVVQLHMYLKIKIESLISCLLIDFTKDIKKKLTAYTRKNRKCPCMPGEKFRKHERKHIKFMPQADSYQRERMTIREAKTTKIATKFSKFGRGDNLIPEFPYYQDQVSSFQQKTKRHTKKKHGPFKEKRNSIETVPDKDLMADILDKQLLSRKNC